MGINDCGWEVIEDPKPMTDGRVDLSGSEGVVKKIISEGTSDEKPTTGFKCSVHYTGKLEDGTIFDSTYERNEPFDFELNKEAVVKGFNMAVASMKKGEKAHFTIKPQHASGASNNPPNIPEDSTVIFEIELLDWHSENLSPKADGGIIREVIKKPKSDETATDGSLVTVHFSGSYRGRQFEEREEEFYVGEIEDDVVIPGIQIAIKRFGKGEKSKLTIKPEYAFGEVGWPVFKIPSNATVEYIVTLKRMERQPESYTLDTKQSLVQAKSIKDRATIYFMQKKYGIAAKVFEKANTYLQNCTIQNPVKLEFIDEPHKLKAAIFSNIALCHLKLQNYYEARKACDTVLEIDPKNVKALYRRGQAKLQSGDASPAMEDFKKVLEIEPENKAAINQITLCEHEIKNQEIKEKVLYQKMLKAKEEEKAS